MRVWLTKNLDFQLVGIDGSGHPLVELDSETALRSVPRPELWLVSGQEQGTELGHPTDAEMPELYDAGTALEDSHGIWMTGVDGDLWLYRRGSGLQLMYRFEDWVTRTVAGPCQ